MNNKCVLCGRIIVYRKGAKYCSEQCRQAVNRVKTKGRYEKLKSEGYFDKYKSGRFLILRRDNFRCIYCGRSSVEDNVKLHIDHIKPKSKGGQDIASNLVTACTECNLSKNDNSLSDYDIIRLTSVIMDRNLSNEISNNQVITYKMFE